MKIRIIHDGSLSSLSQTAILSSEAKGSIHQYNRTIDKSRYFIAFAIHYLNPVAGKLLQSLAPSFSFHPPSSILTTSQLLKQFGAIYSYLDNDLARQNCIQRALSLSRNYKDESSLYKGYKDLNDWVMNIGK